MQNNKFGIILLTFLYNYFLPFVYFLLIAISLFHHKNVTNGPRSTEAQWPSDKNLVILDPRICLRVLRLTPRPRPPGQTPASLRATFFHFVRSFKFYVSFGSELWSNLFRLTSVWISEGMFEPFDLHPVSSDTLPKQLKASSDFQKWNRDERIPVKTESARKLSLKMKNPYQYWIS